MITSRSAVPSVIFLALSLAAPAGGAAACAPQDADAEAPALRYRYPEEAADLVERLRPEIEAWVRETRAAARAEAERIRDLLQSPVIAKSCRKALAEYFGEPEGAAAFEPHWDGSGVDAERLARAWRRWLEGIEAVRFWSPADLRAAYDAGADTFSLSDLVFSRGTGDVTLSPSWLRGLRDSDDLVPPEAVVPFRLDIPYFDRPGSPHEDIAERYRELLREITSLRPRAAREAADRVIVSRIERAALSYLRRTYFRSAETEFIREVCAKHAALTVVWKLLGKEKALARYGPDLHVELPEKPADREQLLTALADRDPLATPPEDGPLRPVLESVAAATFLAAFAELTERDSTPFTRVRDGVEAVPEEGLDARGLAAAISRSLGEEGAFERSLAAHAASLRARLLEADRRFVGPGDSGGAAKAADGRRARTFGGLTVRYPAEWEAVIETAGPRLAAIRSRVLEEAARALDVPEPEIPDDLLESLEERGLPVVEGALGDVERLLRSIDHSAGALPRALSEVDVWLKGDLIRRLQEGQEVSGFRIDREKRTLEFEFRSEGTRLDAASLPLLVPEELAGEASDMEKARLLGEGYEGILRELCRRTGPRFREWLRVRSFFIVVHELVEIGLITEVIASADRRWFCDGVANHVALLECAERRGEDEARALFESLYHLATLRESFGEVDLAAWPAVELEGKATPEVEPIGAYYYLATRAIEAAVRGRGDDFLAKWIAEIRKTPRDRTDMDTVRTAYEKLTGIALDDVVRRAVAAELVVEPDGGAGDDAGDGQNEAPRAGPPSG